MRNAPFIMALLGCLAVLGDAGAQPNADLPDHERTPGFSDPAITETTYRQILCRDENGNKLHTTDERRPSSAYTTGLKKKQLSSWGYADKNLRDYEEDHLVSLELGGSDDSESNLWPEPYGGTWGARIKDGLESELGRRICLGESDSEYISLSQARAAISGNWIDAYPKYVCTRKEVPLTAIMRAHCH